MAELLFGVETEYAIAGMSPGGTMNLEEILQGLMEIARRQLIQLPDLNSGSGIFLQNGSRLYVDCGSHPELCTPECTNPWDVVRYIQAGHRILASLASSFEFASKRGAEIMCFRGNVDYSDTLATWGCHESYLHRMPLHALQPQIIPHLVSRLIYSGAGGFNPFSRGLEFTLSPRMAHFQRIITGSSTNERGIWHTKSESLCAGYNRLHVLCGESLCSETAAFLKVGATALIVAMADAGLDPGSAVQLEEPVAAMQVMAGDVTCKKQIRMTNGLCLTAIAIQRHYLELAEAHVDDSFMPAWAPEVCRRWRELLDQLEDAPGAVAQTLDWGIKLALYANHARSLGIRWDQLPFLNQVIDRLIDVLDTSKGHGKAISLERAIGMKRGIPSEVAFLEPILQSGGFQWEDLRTILHCGQRFFEIDTRFGQVGPKGIFDQLDGAGVLNHRVSGVDNIEQAVTEPPATGRARIRGQAIQRLAGAGDSRCDWQSIVNFQERQILDLSDPFCREESWRAFNLADLRDRRQPPRIAEAFNVERDSVNAEEQSPYARRQDAANRILSGDYSGAESLLRGLLQERFAVPSTNCHLARVLLMTDREEEARQQVSLAWHIREEAPTYVLTRILFFQCLFAMLDRIDIADIVGQIKAALRAYDAHLDWTIQPMLDHLRPRLDQANYRFLQALAGALSDVEAMPQLDESPQWSGLVETSGRSQTGVSFENDERP